MLDRLSRGQVTEVWKSADGMALLEVSQSRHDLAWSQVTLLADGTLVRTSLHSERDAAVSHPARPSRWGVHLSRGLISDLGVPCR
jgi:hypothetical protein